MTSARNNLSSYDLAPSRREVVKYGAAAAISAASIPAHRLLAAEAATVSGIVYDGSAAVWPLAARSNGNASSTPAAAEARFVVRA
jgi:hypothetical protein